jgi:SAM-dependent methyltransferase
MGFAGMVAFSAGGGSGSTRLRVSRSVGPQGLCYGLAMPKPSESSLEEITGTTLGHYEAGADAFWHGTKDHDVSQNLDALLGELEGSGPRRILDFGCGPGRDLAAFLARGHHPVGLDGSAAFAEMARSRTGVEVYHQNFVALDLPPARFDGVFANASLFHVPTSELPRVLTELRTSLVPGGVLFASNPRGDNHEGWSGERYCVYHDLEQWRGFVMDAGFEEIRHYYRPPGLPRDQQPWLATLWRNPALA